MNSPCMQTCKDTNRKSCNKYYPQPFKTVATISEKSGRAEYKRVKNGDSPTIRMRVDGQYKDVKISKECVVP